MSNEPKITVFYEKFYIDSTSKHIPSLFGSNDIYNTCIKQYWLNSIDAFKSQDCITYLTCISGDLKVVFPYYIGNGYKYKQYFITGLDGKIIKIPYNTLFGLQNISNVQSIVMECTSKETFNIQRENKSIFDWS